MVSQAFAALVKSLAMWGVHMTGVLVDRRGLVNVLILFESSAMGITMAGMPCQKKQTNKKTHKKVKANLTTVLHIRELPYLHMKLAVWFSFPTTNNKIQ